MECNESIKKFEEIGGWEKTNDRREAFVKLFQFPDFKQAFSFMTSIAMKQNKLIIIQNGKMYIIKLP